MDVLKALKKASKNEYATIASEGTISDIAGWIDTGCYMLNAMMSGSIFRGIPNNKTVCYSGQSTVGKTYLVVQALKGFLNSCLNNYGIWWASEKAVTKKALKNQGIDVSRLLFLPVPTIEQFNQEAWDELVKIQAIKKKMKDVNFMFILDSLGQLNPQKDFVDLEKSKQKEDMIRAKHIKKAFRNVEWKMAFLQIPMLFTNHVYAKTDSFIPMDIIAGGNGVKFASDIIIAITKAKDRKNDDIIGVILTCTNFKNRIAKENTRIKIKLNYEKGLDRYSGLFNFAVATDIFKEVKKEGEEKETKKEGFELYKEKTEEKKGKKTKTYRYKNKTFTEKDTEKNPEKFWSEGLLNVIDEKCKETFQYGSEYRAEKAEAEEKKEPETKPEPAPEPPKEEKKEPDQKPAKRRGRPPKKK